MTFFKQVARRDFLKNCVMILSVNLLWPLKAWGTAPDVVSPALVNAETVPGLPHWFLQHRVQCHTRLSLRALKRPVFHSVSERLAAVGGHVLTRHVKTRDEGAWWRSRVGDSISEAIKLQVVPRMIAESHRQGLALIGYYRHMEDAYFAKLHPDWICVDPFGTPIKSKRGTYLCLNSPYREAVAVRLEELTSLGVDGLYFDEVHMPKTGCYCSYCRRLFLEKTGLSPPEKIDQTSRHYQRYIDFNNASITAAFAYWTARVKKLNRECVMIVGSHLWPALNDRHLDGALFAAADSVKTEFHVGLRIRRQELYTYPEIKPKFVKDIKMALAFTLARDAAAGRPAHVWVPGLKNSVSATFAAAGIVAHGCVANLDFNERENDLKKFEDAFEMGNRLSADISRFKPWKYVGIYFSEFARDTLIDKICVAERDVLYPVYAVYAMCLRQRIPVGVFTDALIGDADFSDCRYLFYPDKKLMSDKGRAAVARFLSLPGRTGSVFSGVDWSMFSPDNSPGGPVGAEISSARNIFPFAVQGGSQKMHVEFYRDEKSGEILIMIVNDFSWVKTCDCKYDGSGKAPGPCKGVTIRVNREANITRGIDLLTGQELPFKKNSTGNGSLVLQDFEILAAIKFI